MLLDKVQTLPHVEEGIRFKLVLVKTEILTQVFGVFWTLGNYSFN